MREGANQCNGSSASMHKNLRSILGKTMYELVVESNGRKWCPKSCVHARPGTHAWLNFSNSIPLYNILTLNKSVWSGGLREPPVEGVNFPDVDELVFQEVAEDEQRL